MESDDSDEEHFGQELPPLSVEIVNILRRYPDGQIFKELIQNADDAGAKTVHFYLDHRHHRNAAAGLIPQLRAVDYCQGPSLVSYNDAMFSKKDWQGIQKLKQSIKAKDPFKVGQFGIGFNSVYHVTDLPMIVSGEKLGFFEPQMKLWRGESGKSFKLSKMQQFYPGHLKTLDGIADFSSRGPPEYQHTLFRFPLRSKESGLSKNIYTPQKVHELILSLKEEAKVLLLFLRSVESVLVYEINSRGRQRELFKVEVTSQARHELREKRRSFISDLSRSLSYPESYPVSNVLAITTRVTDNIEEEERETRWLISNWVGSSEEVIREAARELETFPWVGTALELGTEIDEGRVFCVLPMPCETVSTLPVHVNGLFSLNDDRRSLKWPGRERKRDSAANWNKLLIEKVLPSCYFLLLQEILKHLSAEQFYSAIPDVEEVRGSHWEGVLVPLCSRLVTECACFCTIDHKWVSIGSATFVPRDQPVEDVVKQVLSCCGHNVVALPRNIWCVLDELGRSWSVRVMSPSIVRGAIKIRKKAYCSRDSDSKLKLLEYCLLDKNYSDLNGLSLLPMADGDFAYFHPRSPNIYVCSDDYPVTLLPGAEDHLVSLSSAHSSLQCQLQKVAHSQTTQLRLLNAKAVASLLPHVFPREWRGKEEVCLKESAFPKNWFKIFWEWVEDHDLNQFKGLLVVPIVSETEFTVVRLKGNSGVVLVQRNQVLLSSVIESILTEVDVKCTFQTRVPYLKHENLTSYLNPLTADGVLTAIEEANASDMSSISNADVTAKEARVFQAFLATSSCSTHEEVLQQLPIFFVLSKETPVSLSHCLDQVGSNNVVFEPNFFSLSPSCLPSNLLVLSQSENHKSLLKTADVVKFPKNMLDFIRGSIFPLIRSNHFKPRFRITALMKEVLGMLGSLSSPKLISEISDLPFLPCSSVGLKSPKSLYDPSSKELSSLYKGEPVFPVEPFDNEGYLYNLRVCGLKTSVSSQELYDILCEVAAEGGELVKVSAVTLGRAQAVMEYIRIHSGLLFDKVMFLSWGFANLGNAICWLVQQKSVLPVVATPTNSYSKHLTWRGSHCTSHLTTMNSSVLPCSSHNINSFPNLVGSQMYIVDCPSCLCTSLCPHPPIKSVVAHLMEVIKCCKQFGSEELDVLVNQIYQYLADNLSTLNSCTDLTVDLSTCEWVWLKRQHKFVKTSDVAFSQHQDFPYSLSPYYHDLSDYGSKLTTLFTSFGAHESITDQMIVSVLGRIQQKSSSLPTDWKIIHDILNWMTDYGKEKADKKIADLSKLYVPVESAPQTLVLLPVKEVVYTDLKYLKNLHKGKKKQNNFIHPDYHNLASCLGVTPLSKHLNISEDVFDDVGQNEPLVKRLKNILRDYKDGLTIIKELIQNADDAEATEVNICFDARQHTEDTDNLIFGGMSRAHGPALIVHNNSSFSDSDFENIQKLAGATKQDQPLKIGKFGVGFCSVYHITDIPSFVSREWLYIFDPTMKWLKDEISNPLKPGKRLQFTDEIVQHSSQMEPYVGLFGLKNDKAYKGTIFRLPFRTYARSPISPMKYGKDHIFKLQEEVKKAGPKLLMFLKNLKKITFSFIEGKQKEPVEVLTIMKTVNSEYSRSHTSSSAKIICLTVTEMLPNTTRLLTTRQFWLVAENSDTDEQQVSGVACSLEKQKGNLYIPKQVSGEVFCFLPLGLETGLPVHVSANFAVMNDRRGIHYSDSTCSSEESDFNKSLMQNSVPASYLMLLETLKSMCEKKKISMCNYDYHSLWPLLESLKTHNPWEYFIPKLFHLIAESELFYSKSAGEWLSINNAKILGPKVLQQEQHKEVAEVLEALEYPLIHLPNKHSKFLKDEIKRCTIDEFEFLDIFFQNIENPSVSIETRNSILLSLIITYANRPSAHLKELIRENACVPCTPDGLTLKKCSDMVDLKSDLKSLYEPEDGVFPVDTFTPVRSILIDLGMVSSKLPWSMLIERTGTVTRLYTMRGKKESALIRISLLLQCISTNLHSSRSSSLPSEAAMLTNVPFLPVLQRPHTYPKELAWAGEGRKEQLLSSSQVLCGRRNINLVGSTAFVLLENPSKGGCGEVSRSVCAALKISLVPKIDDVISHLSHIAEVYRSKAAPSSEWITKACDDIYKYFEEKLDEARECTPKTLLRLNSSPGLLWTGKEFISPDSIALHWKYDGPYLYSLPHLLKPRGKLVEMLKLKESFSIEQILQALRDLKENVEDRRLDQRRLNIVVFMAETLAESVNEDQPILCTDNCFLPDENLHMRCVSDLAYNDAPWCKMDKKFYFIHHKINRCAALKLGVKPVRAKALDEYEAGGDDQWGDAFGQHEDLTLRIRNILESYTQDETVLKELMQNADDAGATKLYFILDKRTHSTEKVPSPEWKDLQGPALLVWNDKGFTEDDIAGIQKLGLGSKRSRAESIGQYGIGFNAVYHLTDCPSFFTNGNMLCILDPHCRYVPGATKLKPGRKMKGVDENFWNNWSDLKTAYLREELNGCPEGVRQGGTLFRFPLRYTQALVDKSELVMEDEGAKPLPPHKVEELFKEWAPKIKEGLLFLKHLTDMRFFVITDGNGVKSSCRMIPTHHFEVSLTEEGKESRSKLLQKAAFFTKDKPEPFIQNYTLILSEKTPKKEEELWLVQQGVGDVSNPSQHWEFLSHTKPVHGIAMQIKGSHFTPKVFCFLPLPLESKLPVHVNGNFMLDSSSRSTLWISRDTQNADDKKRWNNKLIEALGSSYVEFLLFCRSHFFTQDLYVKPREIKKKIEHYYSLFPRWIHSSPGPEGEMKHLAEFVYRTTERLRSEVLVVVKKLTVISHRSSSSSSTPQSQYHLEWHPVLNVKDPSSQVHFWSESEENSNLPAILKRLGMVLCATPMWIWEHFKCVEIKIPKALPKAIYKYFSNYSELVVGSPTSFPCPITDTPFQDVSSMKRFIQYVSEQTTVEDEEGESHVIVAFPSSPFNLPLLLTADEQVRCFDEEEKVIASTFSDIFCNSGERFLHPAILELKLNPDYFMKPSPESWEIISEILQCTLNTSLYYCNRVRNASSHINIEELLRPMWKCLRNDKVFKKHVKDIVSKWALILSEDNELFCYDSDHSYLTPVYPPPRAGPFSYSSSDVLNSSVFDILRKHGMPCVSSIVLKAKDYCPTFDEHAKILANLCYLYNEQNGGGLDSLLADRNISQHIQTLFSYFGDIHFARDEKSLSNIKHLPLFKTIDNRYCCLLNKEVYFWPDPVCSAGIDKILAHIPAIFLSHGGPWINLADAKTLGVSSVNIRTFYMEYVLPHFDLLNDRECFEQLQHIKDSPALFTAAEEYSKMAKGNPQRLLGEVFINSLMTHPLLRKDGELKPVSEFSDPGCHVFKLFPSRYIFPPEMYTEKSWLHFLSKIGLQKHPTKEDFINFCTQVSEGDHMHSDLKRASEVLLRSLFSTYSWHKHDDFLGRVSDIPFVCVDPVEKLAWIKQTSNKEVQYIQQRKRRIGLISLRNCASEEIASLVWCVLPVVKLPPLKYPPTTHEEKEKRRENFMKQTGICSTPSTLQVVQNLIEISQSKFSSFKLFETYNQDCILKKKRRSNADNEEEEVCDLYSVVRENLVCLNSRVECNPQEIFLLSSVPCIPVSSEYGEDMSRPVLVHPLQTVETLPEESMKALHPFLSVTPSDFQFKICSVVLKEIGVNSEVKLENIFKAFSLIHLHVVMPLEPNTMNSIRELLKLLHTHLMSWKPDSDIKDTLYLPSHDRRLLNSKDLLYDDKGLYNKERFDFPSGSAYSMVSLLCDESLEHKQYKFELNDLISLIPESIRPQPMSACCTDTLHSIPKLADTPSDFAKKVQQSFQLVEFSESVRLLLSYNSANARGTCTDFAKGLDNLIRSIEVKTVSELKVDIILQLTNPPSLIGIACSNFLLCRNNEDGHGYSLYIDSNVSFKKYGQLLKSVSKSVVSEVLKITEISRNDLSDPEGAVFSIFVADSPQEIQAILEKRGIQTDLNFHGRRLNSSTFTAKLGDEISEEWCHRLFSDMHNTFKPQELVGYEDREEHFVFARVEYKVMKDESRLRLQVGEDDEGDEDEGSDEVDEYTLDKYVIRLKESGSDNDDKSNLKTVSVVDLYKILRIKESSKAGASKELELYDPGSDSVKMWEVVKDAKLKDIMHMICEDLRRIQRIRDPDERRKALKALYLKWHPDKNDHPLATKAFQFLQQQIQRINEGLDPMEEWDNRRDCPTDSDFRWWDNIARQRRQGRDNERNQGGVAAGGIGVVVVTPDQAKAKVWIEQAKYDVCALKVMFEAAQRDEKLCTHVCFLAHQVAEKSLKAGMFALNGLHPDALQHHTLIGHARAIRQVNQSLASLESYAEALQLRDYYIKTRYPNRFGSTHQVPSNFFRLSEATEAVQYSTNIYTSIASIV